MDNLIIVKGSCMFVKLPQDLDCNNAAVIRSESDKIMEKENIRTIIFDFEKTNFMDKSNWNWSYYGEIQKHQTGRWKCRGN